MAGWLAWNLRIITGVAIALCSYYGADYWSNKDTERNIERINYQDQPELEDQEIENLKPLGPKSSEMARKRFEKTNNGGTASGLDKWFKDIEQRCDNDPLAIHNSDTRRYCRLYLRLEDNIVQLINEENKHVLLNQTNSEDDSKWSAAWQEYKKTNPWGEITEEINKQVPVQFKKLCESKAKELVYDVDDNKYKQVINYCSRDKTIKDVLGVDFKLLSTDENGNTTEIWKTRFNEYKSLDIGAKLHEDITLGDQANGHNRLREACKKAIKLNTTINNYKSVLRAVQRFCKA